MLYDTCVARILLPQMHLRQNWMSNDVVDDILYSSKIKREPQYYHPCHPTRMRARCSGLFERKSGACVKARAVCPTIEDGATVSSTRARDAKH